MDKLTVFCKTLSGVLEDEPVEIKVQLRKAFWEYLEDYRSEDAVLSGVPKNDPEQLEAILDAIELPLKE